MAACMVNDVCIKDLPSDCWCTRVPVCAICAAPAVDPFGGLFVAPTAAASTVSGATSSSGTSQFRAASGGAKVGGISPPATSTTNAFTPAPPQPAAAAPQPTRGNVTPAAPVKKSVSSIPGGFEFDLFGSKKEAEAPRTMKEMRTEKRMVNEDPGTFCR